MHRQLGDTMAWLGAEGTGSPQGRGTRAPAPARPWGAVGSVREGFQEERGSLKRKKAEPEEGRRERSPGWQG